jgi:hypothetical protein
MNATTDRRMATPKKSAYEQDAMRAHLFTVGLTFVVGAMLGASIAIGAMS